MNIVSYNVRGLGRGVKWGAIRRLVRNQKVDMICIQETISKTITQSTSYITDREIHDIQETITQQFILPEMIKHIIQSIFFQTMKMNSIKTFAFMIFY